MFCSHLSRLEVARKIYVLWSDVRVRNNSNCEISVPWICHSSFVEIELKLHVHTCAHKISRDGVSRNVRHFFLPIQTSIEIIVMKIQVHRF